MANGEWRLATSILAERMRNKQYSPNNNGQLATGNIIQIIVKPEASVMLRQ